MVDGSAQPYIMLDCSACSDLVLVVSAQNRCYEVQLTLDGARRHWIILLKLGAQPFCSVLVLDGSAQIQGQMVIDYSAQTVC